MSEQYPTRNSDPLNANLASFILIVSFIVMVGLLIANTSPPSPQVSGEEPVEVALVVPTETSQPSSTPPPPTPTPLPTNTPVATTTPIAASDTATATPQAVAEAGLSGGNTDTAGYDPELVSHGAELFLVCSACHGADARGLPNLGKDLVESEFVHSLNDEELLAFVKTGRPLWDVLNTTGIDMPPKGGNPAFTDEDILAIIAYLRSLSAPTERAIPVPDAGAEATATIGEPAVAYDPALVSHGAELFLVCSACHGADARGLPNLGKNLVESEFVHSLNDEELLTFVKTGRPLWDVLNTTGIDMPPKGGNPAFTDEDILAIIAYLRSLSVGGG